MLSNKWVATVASIWIQCSIGAYTFGIYSSALNSSQGYDQSTLDTVSVFKDIETNIGVLSGLLHSAIAIKNRPSPSSATQLGGPWVVHLAGAFQCFVGYFFMWVVVARGFLAPSEAVSIRVYDIFCGGNPANFLLMLALLSTFISLLLIFSVRTYETTSTVDDKKHLNAFSAIALIIIAYRMIIIILQNFFTFPSWAQLFSFLLLLLLLFSSIDSDNRQ
ncbi:uncharacterized protein LOC132800163 [Ziziphus jujuba]|uniref:Uncharacterized protein LOC132800163 n=1 Tax=Ziziphus jujuba TaxID=326968 RepID=A0ABM3ZXH3_ZIZJJ|nr:uncharacterized protein LOC132800163 [Ziziphus jujuba]